MLTSFAHGVKKYFRSRYPKEFILLSGILVILLVTFFSTVVMADDGQPDNAVGGYTQDGKVTWIFTEDKIVMDLKGFTPSEMERRFPMTEETESAIIHADLPCPVIIDGVRHEGNQISLFNGKRLRYVIGTDGTLYAFTTASGLEEYQAKQPVRTSLRYDGQESFFFKDWWYTGDNIFFLTGYGNPNLSLIGYDRTISSVKASVTATWACLYDQNYFLGNCLAIPGGQDIPQLSTYGWNDRALSVKTE